MKCVRRYNLYKDEQLDAIMLKIKNGTIKCGRYSGLVHPKPIKIRGKVLFDDGSKEDDKSE